MKKITLIVINDTKKKYIWTDIVKSNKKKSTTINIDKDILEKLNA